MTDFLECWYVAFGNLSHNSLVKNYPVLTLTCFMTMLNFVKSGFCVATFSRLFLMGSFLYLQVMMTCMRARMRSKFGQIRPLVSIATDRVIMAKMVSPLFLGCFSSYSFHTCR